MLEIYNEEYKDLLGKGPPAGANPFLATLLLFYHSACTHNCSSRGQSSLALRCTSGGKANHACTSFLHWQSSHMVFGPGKKHTVSHDEKSGATSVSHLESVSCGDPAAVKMLLERAARVRTVGATAANDHSSRSHMVFLLSIHGSNAATGQQLNGAGQATCFLPVFSLRVAAGHNRDGFLAPPWIISPVYTPLVGGLCAFILTLNAPCIQITRGYFYKR